MVHSLIQGCDFSFFLGGIGVKFRPAMNLPRKAFFFDLQELRPKVDPLSVLQPSDPGCGVSSLETR